jgi:hypothetical protein
VATYLYCVLPAADAAEPEAAVRGIGGAAVRVLSTGALEAWVSTIPSMTPAPSADAAREHDVPMPVSSAAQQVVQALVGSGYEDIDFATLLEMQARLSGLELVSEDAPVTDGLRDVEPVAPAPTR